MNKTILIIDDSGHIRDYFKDLFESAGFKTFQAAQAQEALKILESNQIDLITLDLYMPDIDGFELCKKIRQLERCKNIPVIMITGDESFETKAKAFENGVSEFFSKSKANEILVEYVQDLFTAADHQAQEVKGTVLLVDDSVLSRDVIKSLLSHEYMELITAQNGREALEIVRKQPVDLVLTDIEMPEMDGISLTKALRNYEEYKLLPVVIMSSLSEQSKVIHAFMSGANDYVQKPFQRDELVVRINAHLKMSLLQKTIQQKNRYLDELNQQKNQFINMAAHDLRNPLAGIVSAVDLLKEGGLGDLNESQKEIFSIIDNSAQNMIGLIKNLLDVNKIETGNFKIEKTDVNIADFFSKVKVMNALIAESKKIDLAVNLQVNQAKYQFDKDKILQVMNNLISNAVKFSEPENKVHVIVTERNGKLRVEVEDQAGGIPEDEQVLIFTKFAKISRRPTGNESSNGLGLAICKYIIEAHHGEIGFNSTPGQGSVFYFELKD